MNIEQARFNMIEQQIRPWDVLDRSVLELLAAMRREDFVPPALRALAFVDQELPLPCGERMLSPKVEARLLQEAQVGSQDAVLEIGTGSGFMAALLGQRARSVLTLEDQPDLARFAEINLRAARADNVQVRQMDGRAGAPALGPFDIIVLSGSVHDVPADLLAQLKPGGRLMAIVGDEPVMRAVRMTRRDDGGVDRLDLFDTVAPRLRGFAEASRFKF
ncbi:MAG: protein-L-isoaspartate O-methyltransferase family protein [Aquabacterium sp.]